MSDELEYPIDYDYGTVGGRTRLRIRTPKAQISLQWVPIEGAVEGGYLIENLKNLIAAIDTQEGFSNEEVDAGSSGQ